MIVRRVGTEGDQGARVRICIMAEVVLDGGTSVEDRSRPQVQGREEGVVINVGISSDSDRNKAR